MIGTNSWRGPARAYHTDIAHYYPGKRDGGSGDLEPSADEIAHSRHWLERELALVEPDVLVLLGKPAAALFLETYGGLRVRRLADIVGRPHLCRVGGRDVPAFAVYHPSGAWQFPNSQGVYERTGEEISALFTAGRRTE